MLEQNKSQATNYVNSNIKHTFKAILEMDRAFFPYLPTEIIINILSRLPIETIISCKVVCKSWFELLKTPEFIKLHLSKSRPGLIVYQQEMCPDFFSIFRFEDELEVEQHEFPCAPVMEFERGEFIISNDYALTDIMGSVNGLLFLNNRRPQPHALYICNPITREYINLPSPGGIYYYPTVVTYGFGLSKKTNQYKVVRIFHECVRDPVNMGTLLSIPKSECRVYTLGTGSWRSVPHYSSLEYSCRSDGTFLNGNLHWLVSELKESQLISCFELETELFKAFSPPPPYLKGRRYCLGVVAVLRHCLCLCDNTSDNEIVIWIMKEYGVEKSWTKEFVISKLPDRAGEGYDVVYPIKVFRDGDILMLWGDLFFFYYSNKSKTILNVDMFEPQGSGCIQARLHVSTFLSLKSFAMENVAKF